MAWTCNCCRIVAINNAEKYESSDFEFVDEREGIACEICQVSICFYCLDDRMHAWPSWCQCRRNKENQREKFKAAYDKLIYSQFEIEPVLGIYVSPNVGE